MRRRRNEKIGRPTTDLGAKRDERETAETHSEKEEEDRAVAVDGPRAVLDQNGGVEDERGDEHEDAEALRVIRGDENNERVQRENHDRQAVQHRLAILSRGERRLGAFDDAPFALALLAADGDVDTRRRRLQLLHEAAHGRGRDFGDHLGGRRGRGAALVTRDEKADARGARACNRSSHANRAIAASDEAGGL